MFKLYHNERGPAKIPSRAFILSQAKSAYPVLVKNKIITVHTFLVVLPAVHLRFPTDPHALMKSFRKNVQNSMTNQTNVYKNQFDLQGKSAISIAPTVVL